MMLDFLLAEFDLVALTKYNVLGKLTVFICFVNIKLRMLAQTLSTEE